MVDHIRHSGIFQVPVDLGVTIVGVGGIGAITAITLAKMGFHYITLFDVENVEEENVATQFHPYKSIGKMKVHSISEQIEEHDPGVNVIALNTKIDGSMSLTDALVISAVDSIASRKMVWEAAKKGMWRYYLDARMGAEVFHLYAVNHDRIIWYDTRINAMNEDDIPELPCTEKATIYTAMGAAAIIGSVVKRYLLGSTVPNFVEVDFDRLALFNSELAGRKEDVAPLLQRRGDDTPVSV